jgi:gamma-polyglutamate synthase
MVILTLIFIALCCYGAWEFHGHQKRLSQIPIRIHVNGSRGKSSVVRLIAAGLRAGGISTIAKVTGTLPRIIDLDGNEVAIVRNQSPNIIEQTKLLSFISRFNPDAVIIECMAVLPEYQWICERQMVRSHIGVITNARLDHTNEMGKFREQIALSLANTCPDKGFLFTSEKTNLSVFKDVAKRWGTKVARVGGKGNVTSEEMKKFSYIEHPANVGLSLAVCTHLNVDREVALNGMYKVYPDTGALRMARCQEKDKEIVFVNALAANDPESSFYIAREVVTKNYSPLGTEIIMLNSRADRQDRSVQLIEMMAKDLEFDYLVLTGEQLQKFMGFARKFKIPKSKIIGLGHVQPDKAYDELFKLIENKGTVLGIGNMGAGGIDIFRHFYNNRRIDA